MISVIIPTYNSEKTIARCLKSIFNQNYPKNKFEVIVSDDGSTDNTKKIVSQFKRVKFISNLHQGPAATRNIGVKKSKGDIVLFTDSDCVVSKNWINEFVRSFKDSEIIAVAGAYRTLNKKKLIARFVGYEISERYKRFKKNQVDFIGTYSAGYRRNIFLKFGGFDSKFSMPSGEDPELSFRITKKGFKTLFNPKAIVYHEHPDNIFKYIKQKFWRGFWRVLLYKKHRDKMLKNSYTPNSLIFHILFTCITSLIILSAIIGFFSTYLSLLTFLLLFLTTLPFSLRISKYERDLFLITPWIVILRNISIGLGIFFGLIDLIVKG